MTIPDTNAVMTKLAEVIHSSLLDLAPLISDGHYDIAAEKIAAAVTDERIAVPPRDAVMRVREHRSGFETGYKAGVTAARKQVLAWLRDSQGKGTDEGEDYASDFADALEYFWRKNG
jgi:hypothetical protein